MTTEATTQIRPRNLRSTDTDNSRRSNDMYGMAHLLIHEHMSRARMPKPQSNMSEASRSAREIAIRSRKEQRRLMGNW
jgi:hypothetical protein